MKEYLKQTWKWCKVHWKWLTLMILFSIAYMFGKNNSKNLLKMARLERDQYQKEKEQMKGHVNKKLVRDNEAIKKYEKTIELLKDDRDEKIKKFEDMEEETVLKELGIKKV